MRKKERAKMSMMVMMEKMKAKTENKGDGLAVDVEKL